MANPIVQYLKDTRSELNHVAWPTREQTIVFTILVAAISIGVAAYLGFFDFLFTTGLSGVINNESAQSAAQTQTTQQASSSAITVTTSTGTAPSVTGPSFGIPGTTPDTSSQ